MLETDIVVSEAASEISDDGGEAPGVSLAFLILAGWLSAAREECDDARMAGAVTAWIDNSLGADCARMADRAAGIIGGGSAGDLTVQELADELQADFLPALIWLTTGVVAEYGAGAVGWLSRDEPDDGPDLVAE